jgi:hypothetical protein
MHASFFEIHSAIPLMHQVEKSQLTGGIFLQGLLDCDEILQALAHLLAFNVKMSSVQKVVDPLLAVIISF